ncbi:uncharacterized protein LOC111711962 [Eurytemora carolleeae]|uniref:uncharacterized protein LOC111711962 n=1 Tax=Eurytemora carolleeae TaxID=1294199 RepID=UPI000C78D5ED|nr:uncharacterized protein LOC111711962 [Eurytemora carolleeae]|eukprot:XP_023342220.1 uncharacterized protein LOC111711962 [Eurytemora affinis]
MSRTGGKTFADVVYPCIPPRETGMLKVTDIHTLYWEVSGLATGEPVVVLHGGPGGGTDPDYRRYFNPEKYNIVMLDQRGCGKSTPHAELQDNNTQALVGDIETLRKHLEIEKWFVFGGSWGSTLSLIYAIHHPDRVKALILRGIFMCRRSELLWFYQVTFCINTDNVNFGQSHPLWVTTNPVLEVSILLRNSSLTGKSCICKILICFCSSSVRESAAREWCLWEMSTSKLIPDTKYLDKADNLEFAAAFSRIECHYFVNHIFVEEGFILKKAQILKDIPIFIVQGRYDVVCPMKSAWELHTALPHSKLTVVADAGHSMGEVGIAEKLVEVTDQLA